MLERNGFTYPDVAAAIRSFTIYDEDGQVIYTPNVDEVRLWAADAVNQWAGEQRSLQATNIPFQDSVYAEKEAEARLCLADAEPTAEEYPYCEIERGIIEAAYGACTLHQAAGFIAQVAETKRAASIAIEAKRRQVGAAVAAAASIEAIEAALVALMQ
jgi:hypothetical protein